MNEDFLKKRFEGHFPQLIGAEQGEYSVLIPFIKKNDEFCLIFERRSGSVSQPGEISFPGGKKEVSDTDLLYTAIRETKEELGLREQDIRNTFSFDILVTPFNKVIYSYTAFVEEHAEFFPNKDEVEELLFIPFSSFVKQEPEAYFGKVMIERAKNFPFEKIPNKEQYAFATGSYITYFYQYNDVVIWGLTASLLKNLIDVFKK